METLDKPEPQKATADRVPTRVQEAIGQVVAGKTMEQACLDLGVNESYLSGWKRRNPQLYKRLYLATVDEADFDNPAKLEALDRLGNRPRQKTREIREAIAKVVAGRTLEQASQESGFNKSWLGKWKFENPDLYEEFYLQASDGPVDDDKLIELALDSLNNPKAKKAEAIIDPAQEQIEQIEAGIGEIVAGQSPSQASLNQGRTQSWLSLWIANHPELYEQLYLQAVDEANPNEQVRQAAIKRMRSIQTAIDAKIRELRVSNSTLF